MIPFYPMNFFILFQLVSWLPNILKTALNMSWIVSTGIIKLFISFMLDLVIDPIAFYAFSTSGIISDNSYSIYFFDSYITFSSYINCDCIYSVSDFLFAAFSIALLISFIAESASVYFFDNCFLFWSASTYNWLTYDSASFNLSRPNFKCEFYAPWLPIFWLNINK